ncbi:MAG: flagellar motor stator protein MotA [candidate division NC10 bacterium]|uniref:Flagellar motor stator protein MotA n=1 Tax=Tectimicrobiota bacterium TaxID=2528274 RepID=A0A932I236_UNCTE|nr:flagellar motor stator protein MotA [candidate division NC10 bacterium]MBI3128357.1 flagellar motor stator protein MotA [Candidatus Tectomicrobia bacterium]
MAIAGIVVVLGAVIGGYLMEHGELAVLFQPAEVVIIFGAALGAVFISTPMKVQVALFGGVLKVLLGKTIKKQNYIELLCLLSEIFQMAKKDGLLVLESHVEKPESSSLFKKYPGFMSHHHAVEFLTDSAKIIIVGGVASHELEALMDSDIEIHHEETARAPGVLSKVSDSMPGLGIVAAVLGIILTMAAIDGPPAEIGHKVGAALVGTFLGILAAYGFLSPLAAGMELNNQDEAQYIQCIKAGLLAFEKGLSPMIAIEFARRSIMGSERPGMKELEEILRKKK